MALDRNPAEQALVQFYRTESGEDFAEFAALTERSIRAQISLRIARSTPAREMVMEDIYQQVMLNLYQSRMGTRWEGKPNGLWGWLSVVIRHAASSSGRSRKRHEVLSTDIRFRSDDDSPLSVEDYLESSLLAPAVAMIRSEENLLLREAIAQLPDDQRTVIQDHIFNGIPQKEIAADLAVSPPTVCRLLEKAKKNLAAMLCDEAA